MDKTGIEIIGKGNIGDKARQLLEKTPKLRSIGFHTPRRVVLAEDFFNGFFQRNGLGRNLCEAEITGDLEEKIKCGSLTKEEFQTLQRVTESFERKPIVVRSSAEGDARGTGTYSTEFSESRIGDVRKAIQRVLSSYFSEDAILFRRDAVTGEGFGVIIEPIIGQGFEGLFAPVLSGFGYTSTSRGEGYVNIVPGLGGGVDSRDGEKITKSKIQKHNGSLSEYMFEERCGMVSHFDEMVRRRSALLRTDTDFISDSYSGKAFFPSTKYRQASVDRTCIDLEGRIGEPFDRLNLTNLFEMIMGMEESFGKPQYFEWAMTIEDGEPKYWITQIADVSKRLDMMDFGDLGDVLFMGHTVTGTGINECHKIANCWNPSDVDLLYEFNQRNRNYVLIFSSRLTTLGTVRKLRYSDFNNASVFLEIQDARHIGDPVAHLGGQLDMAGKLFGVLDYHAEVPPQWDNVKAKETDEGGIRVYQGKVKAIASERQNKMVVAAIE